MSVTRFPTEQASDRIIDRAMHTQGTRAAVGDVCVFCVDADEDIWTAQLVGAVDDRGTVLAIRTSDGELVSWRSLAAMNVLFVHPAKNFDPEGLKAHLLWREFRGVAEVQKAGRPIRVRP